MKKALVFFIFIASLSKVYCQILPIVWGEYQKTSGKLAAILPKNNLSYIALRWSGGNTFGSYRLENYENLTFLEQKKVKLNTLSGIGTFETACYFGGKTCVFLSDFANSKMMLFLQKYDDYLNTEDDPQLLAEYENRKFNSKPNFQIVTSNNNKFLSVFWQIPGKSTQSDSYGYKIYDSNFMEIQAGEYAIPIDGNLTIINNYHLTDQGDCLISLTEYTKSVDRLFADNNENFKTIHIYKLKNNILSEFSLNMEGLRVEELRLNSNDSSTYSLIGIYSKGNLRSVTGILSLQIDAINDTIRSSGFIPLSIDSGGDKWDNESQFMRQNFGRSMNSVRYNYKLRDVFIQNDGSILASVEQFYIYRRVNIDNRSGISTSTNYYYYDDIIAFKINTKNNLDWEKRIQKSQVSVNDQGSYSSYSSFVMDTNFCLIFNDNSINYNDEGDYLRGNSKPAPNNFSRQRNASSLVQIDNNTGNSSRKTFISKNELDGFLIPKMFVFNTANKELLFVAYQGFKEKLGLLKLN
jgi:hypothetical protein